MTGWEKVAAATAVAVLGLAGLNLAIWRRVRAAIAAGRACEPVGTDIHADAVYPESRHADREMGQ